MFLLINENNNKLESYSTYMNHLRGFEPGSLTDQFWYVRMAKIPSAVPTAPALFPNECKYD
jgi:hypothetical protein